MRGQGLVTVVPRGGEVEVGGGGPAARHTEEEGGPAGGRTRARRLRVERRGTGELRGAGGRSHADMRARVYSTGRR
jgi:hypothetical protein